MRDYVSRKLDWFDDLLSGWISDLDFFLFLERFHLDALVSLFISLYRVAHV